LPFLDRPQSVRNPSTRRISSRQNTHLLRRYSPRSEYESTSTPGQPGDLHPVTYSWPSIVRYLAIICVAVAACSCVHKSVGPLRVSKSDPIYQNGGNYD